MDRYFCAFENGTMPEDTCAPRIATLNEQAKALEVRADELAALDDAEQPERTTDADLQALRNTSASRWMKARRNASRPSSRISPRKSA
jgi:hypothetical protein